MRSILLNVGVVFALVWGLVLSSTVYAASFTCVVNGRVFSSNSPCFSNSGLGLGEGLIDRSATRGAVSVGDQNRQGSSGARKAQPSEERSQREVVRRAAREREMKAIAADAARSDEACRITGQKEYCGR